MSASVVGRLLLALLATLSTPAGAAPPDGFRRGVNLEGWLGAGPFVPLGASQLNQLRSVRAVGFDYVRVPVDPALFINAQTGSAEPQASLDRLLREARARGLGVLVALAPDDKLKRQVLRGGLARDTYLALLEQLAGRLRASGLAHLMLEPLDEPVDPGRSDCGPSAFDYPAALSDLVSAVRRGAPTLPVLVSGLCYADADSLVDLRPLADHRVMYGFQYLDPLNFTQQGNPTDDTWKKLSGVHYTAADTDRMRKTFTSVGGWARQYGVPVLLTSFTVHGSAPEADRLRWLQDVRSLAERQGFAWTVWSWQSPYGYGLSAGGKTLTPSLKRALGL